MKAKWALVAVVVVVLGGGIAFAAFTLGDDEDPAPEQGTSETPSAGESVPPAVADVRELIPAQPFVYAETSLAPSDTQRDALDQLLAKFPALGGLDPALDRVEEQIDKGLQEEADMSFAEDVEPWLGDEIAGFSFAPQFTSTEAPPGAALIEVTDEAAARAFFEEFLPTATEGKIGTSEYDGVEYLVEEEQPGDDGNIGALGFVGGYAVFGNEAGLHRVIDTTGPGEALSESDRFSGAVEGLPEDRLGLLYFDLKTAVQGIPGFAFFSASAGGPLAEVFEQSQAIAMFAQPDALVFESAGQLLSGGFGGSAEAFATDEGLMGELPRASWLGVSIPEFGPTARTLLDELARSPGADLQAVLGPLETQFGIDIEKDFLSWIGDVGIFARGTNPLGVEGGAVLESNDPKTSLASLGKLRKILARTGAPVKSLGIRADGGFSIKDRFTPQPVNFAADGDRVAIVYGDDATVEALSGGTGLGDDPAFIAATESLGDEFTPSFYVAAQPVIALIEASLGGADPVYTEEVRPNLEPLSHVIVGSRVEGDKTFGRLLIGTE